MLLTNFLSTISGKTFAEMNLKAVISTIILKYYIKPCDKTEIPVKLDKGSITLHNSDGIWVNFIKRKIETPFHSKLRV